MLGNDNDVLNEDNVNKVKYKNNKLRVNRYNSFIIYRYIQNKNIKYFLMLAILILLMNINNVKIIRSIIWVKIIDNILYSDNLNNEKYELII